MAMMTGRLRSALPLLTRALPSQYLHAQISTLQRPIPCPNSASSGEFSRNYATPSRPKEEKQIKVPLTLFGVFGNYASALYLAAAKANVLDEVESELIDFVEASRRSPSFSQFMKNLAIPMDTRVNAINGICSEAKLSVITKNFLVLLAENGRLRSLETIAKRFMDLCMARRGEVKVTVTTVIPLPPEEEKELKETLQGLIGVGKTALITNKIDPKILGGLVVEFDHKLFDMSLRTRAQQFERLLRAPIPGM